MTGRSTSPDSADKITQKPPQSGGFFIEWTTPMSHPHEMEDYNFGGDGACKLALVNNLGNFIASNFKRRGPGKIQGLTRFPAVWQIIGDGGFIVDFN